MMIDDPKSPLFHALEGSVSKSVICRAMTITIDSTKWRTRTGNTLGVVDQYEIAHCKASSFSSAVLVHVRKRR